MESKKSLSFFFCNDDSLDWCNSFQVIECIKEKVASSNFQKSISL